MEQITDCINARHVNIIKNTIGYTIVYMKIFLGSLPTCHLKLAAMYCNVLLCCEI